jgi:hypothetical protein
MNTLLKRTLAAAGLAFAALAAHAEPVTWTLNNVQFDDGGTASGWFVWDAAVWNVDQNKWGVYGAFDIQTSTGAGLGWNYSSADGNNFAWHIDMFTANSLAWAANGGDEPWIDLQFASALPDGGNATVAVSGGWECDALFWTACRSAVSGEVQASPATVPEPGSIGLAGVALFGLSVAARRHRRA